VCAAAAVLTRSKDELLELIEYERWRQAKLDAEISTYQCRLLRLGEQLYRDSSVSSLTSSSQVNTFVVNAFSTDWRIAWNVISLRSPSDFHHDSSSKPQQSGTVAYSEGFQWTMASPPSFESQQNIFKIAEEPEKNHTDVGSTVARLRSQPPLLNPTYI